MNRFGWNLLLVSSAFRIEGIRVPGSFLTCRKKNKQNRKSKSKFSSSSVEIESLFIFSSSETIPTSESWLESSSLVGLDPFFSPFSFFSFSRVNLRADRNPCFRSQGWNWGRIAFLWCGRKWPNIVFRIVSRVIPSQVSKKLDISKSRAKIRAKTKNRKTRWAPFRVVIPKLIDAKGLFKALVHPERSDHKSQGWI